jgi:FkbM family methyltransferase
MTLRSAADDRRVFINIFGRDEYRMGAFRPGALDTVIDVGAHVGIFARRAARCARRVLSFEPAPETYEFLDRNVEGCPNVVLTRAAVTDHGGTARPHVFAEPTDNSLFPDGREDLRAVVEVDATTLLDVFERHGVERCDLLKLDVEGAEYAIVFGAPEDLWRRVDRVAMEYHLVPGAPSSWSGEGIAAVLRRAGHEVEVLPRGHHPGKGLLFSTRR